MDYASSNTSLSNPFRQHSQQYLPCKKHLSKTGLSSNTFPGTLFKHHVSRNASEAAALLEERLRSSSTSRGTSQEHNISRSSTSQGTPREQAARLEGQHVSRNPSGEPHLEEHVRSTTSQGTPQEQQHASRNTSEARTTSRGAAAGLEEHVRSSRSGVAAAGAAPRAAPPLETLPSYRRLLPRPLPY